MANRTLSSPKINVQMSATVQNTLDDTVVASAAVGLTYNPKLTSGVSESQANRAWQSKSRSLGSGATEVIDLYDFVGTDIGAGDGRDGVGQVLTLEEIVAIVIVNENDIDAAGQLEVEPDPVNGWDPIGTHTVATLSALRGQGMLMKCQPAENGFDILDANHHRLLMTANGGAVTYSIYVLARHDDNESSSSSSSSSSSGSSSSSSSSASSSST